MSCCKKEKQGKIRKRLRNFPHEPHREWLKAISHSIYEGEKVSEMRRKETWKGNGFQFLCKREPSIISKNRPQRLSVTPQNPLKKKRGNIQNEIDPIRLPTDEEFRSDGENSDKRTGIKKRRLHQECLQEKGQRRSDGTGQGGEKSNAKLFPQVILLTLLTSL